jgi:Zn-dependent peptidase ImmA (M78 family)
MADSTRKFSRFDLLEERFEEGLVLAEEHAAKVLARNAEGLSWSDLVMLAEQLGAPWVDTCPLSVSALTTVDGVILVNSKESPLRQRFSLAHEIGHLFLNPKLESQIWLRVGPKDSEKGKAREAIEAFCDSLAAAILMPRILVEPYLRGQHLTPLLVIQTAQSLGVSVRAFAIRAAELSSSLCSISSWVIQADKEGIKLVLQWESHSSHRHANRLREFLKTAATTESAFRSLLITNSRSEQSVSAHLAADGQQEGGIEVYVGPLGKLLSKYKLVVAHEPA